MFATYVGFALLSYPLRLLGVRRGLRHRWPTDWWTDRNVSSFEVSTGKPEINPIVVMVGFLIVLEAVAAAIWSSFPRSLPTPFSFKDWQLAGKAAGTVALHGVRDRPRR